MFVQRYFCWKLLQILETESWKETGYLYKLRNLWQNPLHDIIVTYRFWGEVQLCHVSGQSFLPQDNYNMDQGSRVEKESKALAIIRIYSAGSTRARKCS